MCRTPPVHPSKLPAHARVTKADTAQAVRDFVRGSTYSLQLDLADFHFNSLNGTRPKGRKILRQLIFTPAEPKHLRGGTVWIGTGRVDGETLPGVCWVGVNATGDRLHVGLGFSPTDFNEPAGTPGMLRPWIGATTDIVLSVGECP